MIEDCSLGLKLWISSSFYQLRLSFLPFSLSFSHVVHVYILLV